MVGKSQAKAPIRKNRAASQRPPGESSKRTKAPRATERTTPSSPIPKDQGGEEKSSLATNPISGQSFASVVTTSKIKGDPSKKDPNHFIRIGSAIGQVMGILDTFSYSDKLLIMKSLNGAVGISQQRPIAGGPVTRPSPAASASPVQSTKTKPASKVSSASKKRKRVAPPPQNPANKSEQVVLLKKELEKTLGLIKDKRTKIAKGEPKELSSKDPLVIKKNQLLSDLTVAKGKFRAFENLKIGSQSEGGIPRMPNLRPLRDSDSWADADMDIVQDEIHSEQSS
uniref:Uncharacterized protein n=1 Tax=Bremia lactucae associated ORFan virus 5 TaxID=3070699 RepID=A0AA50F4C9_9VIRU|nr:hypothetical protein [Bremia lactucae associated ORFan virus 5]